MIYAIEFTDKAKKSIKKWKKSNAVLYKKYSKILEELMLHPRTGIGHPEPLIKGSGIRYSRHITAHDRIIYDIYDNVVTVLVIQVGGHYDDK